MGFQGVPGGSRGSRGHILVRDWGEQCGQHDKACVCDNQDYISYVMKYTAVYRTALASQGLSNITRCERCFRLLKTFAYVTYISA